MPWTLSHHCGREVLHSLFAGLFSPERGFSLLSNASSPTRKWSWDELGPSKSAVATLGTKGALWGPQGHEANTNPLSSSSSSSSFFSNYELLPRPLSTKCFGRSFPIGLLTPKSFSHSIQRVYFTRRGWWDEIRSWCSPSTLSSMSAAALQQMSYCWAELNWDRPSYNGPGP